ncbi:hypothetical protein K7640_20205 [Micromonospora sp. PLK6-60]|uniref:hypothetical protein n=1 Tax=Micromonospora sp. PLK6-60 TaxID=2873383 RepID=UPI001CA705A1|nr:hypothetical protein [Micromonospora sp. PLK6-60]MBY8874154.1 hypothetical protein [Micromonospora sp. PLK6-60]
MRALILILPLVVAVLLLALAVGRALDRRSARSARWQVVHYGQDGHTVVAVGLLPRRGGTPLDEHVVDRIPAGDPEWTTRFLHAREVAEERAFHLNSGPTALPG